MKHWHGSVVAAAFAAVGTAYGQQPARPQNGPPIIINNNAAPQPLERDKCEPINRRLNGDRCDSMLSPSRTIFITGGAQRIIHFDRPFGSIEYDSNPRDAVNIALTGDNTGLHIDVCPAGATAELYVFGTTEHAGGAQPPTRDVMLAASIICGPPLSSVRIHNRQNLHEAIEYFCSGDGCQTPGRVTRPIGAQ